MKLFTQRRKQVIIWYSDKQFMNREELMIYYTNSDKETEAIGEMLQPENC